MICVLIALTLAGSTLIDLESVSGEWVSPDYTFSKEVLIEFADHGPMFSNDDQLFVGSHVCYIDIEGNEKWRATVLFEDRVILFQKDEEPIVTVFDFSVDNCSFSQSGNYVVLHDGGAIDTDRNGLRINAETGESLYFDAQPEGMLGRALIVIWDDGRLKFSRAIHEHYYKMFWLSTELEIVNSIETYYPHNQGVSTNYHLICFDGALHAYNSDGLEEWSHDLPSSRQIVGPIISESHECFVLASDQIVEVISLINGDILFSYDNPEGSIPLHLSINEEKAEFTCIFSNDHTEYSLTASLTDRRIIHNPEQTYPFNKHVFIDSSDNKILLVRQNRTETWDLDSIYLLCTNDYNVLYASPSVINPSIWGMTNRGNNASLFKLGNQLLISTPSSIICVMLEKE